MSTYLMHHGIKGQKWGIRRFQNDDGTLTEAGKARYGGQREYNNNGLRKALTGSNTLVRVKTSDGRDTYVEKTTNERMADRYTNRALKSGVKAYNASMRGNSQKYQKQLDKTNKSLSRAEAYRKLNADRVAYDRHTSTGKMFAQNYLLGSWATGEVYRNSRAMGRSRGQAFVDSFFKMGIGQGKRVEEHYRDAE